MASLQLIALAAIVLTATAIPDSIVNSAVVWEDANFKGELGSMPLGNGDLASNVWVEEATGDLLYYIAKSNVFDQNSQPVKVGRVRMSFNPPLWSKASVSQDTQSLGNYTGPIDNTIGGQGQGQQILSPSGSPFWPGGTLSECPAKASSTCESQPSCNSFSCCKSKGCSGKFQLHTTGLDAAVKNKGDWQFYYRTKPRPQPPAVFTQTLNLAGGAVDIKTASGYIVKVWVDANAPVLRVQASNAKAPFKVTAKLEVYRTTKQKTTLGRGFCNTYNDIPDVVVKPQQNADGKVTWYHRNDYAIANAGQSSFYDWAIKQAGVDPTVLPDPFNNLTFGGILRSIDHGALKQMDDVTVGMETAVHAIDLVTTVYATQTGTSDEWVSSMRSLDSKTSSSAAALPAHEKWWESFWDRSHIDMPMRATDTTQKQVESQYVYARYLDACDGRNAGSAIKFNGQAFTVDMGKGPDDRSWGACYWFQNTRQPYYNALAAGDLDIMRPIYAFYNRSIPVIEARVAAQFAKIKPAVKGGVWPETMTQFGTYNEGDWGCNTQSSGSSGLGDSSNQYIRFHFTGSLELALMTLDDYTMTGDTQVLRDYGLPICNTVTEFFRTRFPNVDSKTGKTDMWPTQALETHQCPDPTSRSKCPTNPSTDVAGLRAVLTRLLALPTKLPFITSTMRAAWKSQLDLLPDLPKASDGSILAVAPGYTEGDHNSENTELYPVHPFRLYGTGKPDLDAAQKTYAKRKHKCNDGWCQGIIDAAMLNMTDDAMKQVAQRAASTAMFRFQGFAGHFQDYEPSLDHFSFMRTAMHYMLMSPLDDAKQGVLLFPTWPTDKWNVDFKLHAPLNTIIEAACVNGTLTKLIVTPKSREADVKVLNCKKTTGSEEQHKLTFV